MPESRFTAKVLPVHQTRSARTLERILAAVEQMLADGDLEQVTIEQIAERAHVSVGAFYKRFRGKSSLLPILLQRVHEQQTQRIRALLEDPELRDVSLARRIDALLFAFARSQQARHHLIRALVIGHWQSAERADSENRSAELLQAAHGWLAECIDEIRHPDPRLALSLGLFATLQSMQTAIIFERIPANIGIDRFTDEFARMFKRYVGVDDAS